MACLLPVRNRKALDFIKRYAYNIYKYSHNETTSKEIDTHDLLKHFNTASPEEIARFHAISLQKATDIVAYRKENGNFGAFSEITNVNNVGSKTVARILEEYRKNGCQLPEPEDEASEVRYKLPRKIIYPAFVSSELPESAVAFCVQMDAVYWARMTRDLCLADWSYTELGKHMHRKYDHAVHLVNLWQVLWKIPHGSIYLTEEVFFAPSTRALTSSTLNLARLESMLMLALNLRNPGYSFVSEQPPEQKVHRIKTSELARHFGLLIGNEKVSSQGVAMDIIKGRRKATEVFASHQQCSEFMECRRNVKEQLSNCLLQVTMFYEMLLEQEGNISDSNDFASDVTS